MMKMAIAIACFLLLLSPAHSATILWTCAYPGFSSGGQVLTEYRQSDGFLQGEWIRYQILQNNIVGLVAVNSYAVKDSVGLHLGADMIVINKKTGDLIKGPFSFHQIENSANVDHRRGKCTSRFLTD